MEMDLEGQDSDMQSWEMSKGTILVSGASGIVGYGILKSLKSSGYTLIGTTIYGISPANCFANIVEIAPKTEDKEYIPWLIETIEKYDVKMIIPGIEADMSCWNSNREVLEKTGTYVLLNNPRLVDLCLDKWRFYEVLNACAPSYAIDSSIEVDFERFNLPFLLKPRCSYGSKGIIKVEAQETYNKHVNEIGTTLMAQRLIGTDDEEYTISGFFDFQSNLKAYVSMKRKLSIQGFTESAEIVYIAEMEDVLRELAEIFKPVGPTNFQFRKQDKHWKLMEINPRISSSTSIRTSFGFNECQMCIDYFLKGMEIFQPRIKSGKAIRYTEDYIFYDSVDF